MDQVTMYQLIISMKVRLNWQSCLHSTVDLLTRLTHPADILCIHVFLGNVDLDIQTVYPPALYRNLPTAKFPLVGIWQCPLRHDVLHSEHSYVLDDLSTSKLQLEQDDPRKMWRHGNGPTVCSCIQHGAGRRDCLTTTTNCLEATDADAEKDGYHGHICPWFKVSLAFARTCIKLPRQDWALTVSIVSPGSTSLGS